jgi:hypothetical protein
MLKYLGMDNRGIARSGSLMVADLAKTAERWFDQGWRWVKVRDGSDLVGEITRNPDGVRTWWVEVNLNA